MKRILIYSIVMVIFSSFVAMGQNNHGSPANWRYQGGDANGTKHQIIVSNPQVLDSFYVKWSTPLISGDIMPLVGNLVNNRNRVGDLPYSPNEMAAFVGDTLFIIDGFGKIYARRSLYDNFKWLNQITCLFDTLQTEMDNISTTNHIMGLSSLEYQSPDTVANAFIVGYDERLDSVRLLSRLAVNMNDFSPNTYASLIPVGGQRIKNVMTYFATVNQSHPTVKTTYDPAVNTAPYFRGIATFPAKSGTDVYPFSDIGDDKDKRVFYSGDMTQGYTSLQNMESGALSVLLPCKPTPELGTVNIESGINSDTYSNIPYCTGLEYVDGEPSSMFFDIDMSYHVDQGGVPYIRSYFVDITDNNTEERGFILTTEEYSGLDKSVGTPKLYLADYSGFLLTTQSNADAPPFKGTVNHHWSVAVGNIDGRTSNQYLPYYPNNIGNEIIVTQSSRDFAVPSSKLFIMKYNSGERVEKPNGSGKKLFQLDTICSYQINGWVAAVNDIDGRDDNKDEIFLVDGSKVMVLTMRNYREEAFRGGSPFDTVLVKEFPNKTISYLSVVDIDGDEKNDIIVTTHDSTYVYGVIIPNTLEVKMPLLDDEVFCLGDTVHIEWENYISGQDYVDIYFRPYENGVPIPTHDIMMKKKYPNPDEIVWYDLHIDERLLGKTGRFIVRSVSKPQYQIDSTAIVRFSEPEVWPILDNKLIYEMGEPITLIGGNFCNDSLLIQYMDIDGTWTEWATFSDPDSYDYSFSTFVPCVPFFNCTGPDTVKPVLHCRYVLFQSIYTDTLGYFDLKVKPYPFPLEWEKSKNANPNIMFSWDSDKIDMPVDTVIFSFSLDNGKTFQFGKRIAITDNEYYWQVPTTGPIQALARFCCENSCVRTDTLLAPWLPQYINIVAPNPFQPYLQELQIVYQVPKDNKIDIKIFDQNNRMVAHPVKGRYCRANIMYTDTWDGIREFDNSPCAVGMYYIIFQLSDGQKEIHPVFIKN